jgi:hypothetical protein
MSQLLTVAWLGLEIEISISALFINDVQLMAIHAVAYASTVFLSAASPQ